MNTSSVTRQSYVSKTLQGVQLARKCDMPVEWRAICVQIRLFSMELRIYRSDLALS